MSNIQFLVLFLCYHLFILLLSSRSVVNPFFSACNFLITADPYCLVISTVLLRLMKQGIVFLPLAIFFFFLMNGSRQHKGKKKSFLYLPTSLFSFQQEVRKCFIIGKCALCWEYSPEPRKKVPFCIAHQVTQQQILTKKKPQNPPNPHIIS